MTRSPLFIVGVLLLAVTLTGCSTSLQSSPNEIMTEVSQKLAGLSSAQYRLKLSLKGSIPSSLGNLDAADINLAGGIVSQADGVPNYSVLADISALSSGTSVHLGGQIISLADYTYFQLTDLSLPSLLPVSLGVDKKWYKVKTAGDSDGGNTLDTRLTESEFTVIQNLISDSHPVEVIEVLPTTTVNGIRAYHYKTQINPSELDSLLTGINEVLKSSAVLPPLEYLADYQPEIFISSRDHQLLQIKTSGLYLQDNLPVAFELTLGLANHNQEIALTAPKASENLDGAKLFNLPKLPF